MLTCVTIFRPLYKCTTLTSAACLAGSDLTLTPDLPSLQRKSLQELLYLADNLAYFPYQVSDEVLFIIHQVRLGMNGKISWVFRRNSVGFFSCTSRLHG